MRGGEVAAELPADWALSVSHVLLLFLQSPSASCLIARKHHPLVSMKLLRVLHDLRVPACFVQEVGSLARAGRFDQIVVESTGIGEPLPVAAAFAAVAPNGQMLADVAELDTMVCALRPVDDIAVLPARDDSLEYIHLRHVQ